VLQARQRFIDARTGQGDRRIAGVGQTQRRLEVDRQFLVCTAASFGGQACAGRTRMGREGISSTWAWTLDEASKPAPSEQASSVFDSVWVGSSQSPPDFFRFRSLPARAAGKDALPSISVSTASTYKTVSGRSGEPSRTGMSLKSDGRRWRKLRRAELDDDARCRSARGTYRGRRFSLNFFRRHCHLQGVPVRISSTTAGAT